MLACAADKHNLIYLICASANHFFYGIKLHWMGFLWQNLIGAAHTFVQRMQHDWSNSAVCIHLSTNRSRNNEMQWGIIGKQLSQALDAAKA